MAKRAIIEPYSEKLCLKSKLTFTLLSELISLWNRIFEIVYLKWSKHQSDRCPILPLQKPKNDRFKVTVNLAQNDRYACLWLFLHQMAVQNDS